MVRGPNCSRTRWAYLNAFQQSFLPVVAVGLGTLAPAVDFAGAARRTRAWAAGRCPSEPGCDPHVLLMHLQPHLQPVNAHTEQEASDRRRLGKAQLCSNTGQDIVGIRHGILRDWFQVPKH